MDYPSTTAAPRRVALLTQHGKERVLAPLLAGAGFTLVHATGVDTDTLGSFTREVPRAGSQLEAARRKARLGMELTGLRRGLGSEGSFAPDPFAGLFPWNLELLVWIDDDLGLEIVASAQGPGGGASATVSSWKELRAHAAREGFPAQGLVLRPEHEAHAHVVKDLADEATLRAAYETCVSLARDGRVFVEPDLRAHACPERMRRIEEAGRDLVARLQSRCPGCDAPGWAATRRLAGRPCADCGTPTALARATVWGCVRCARTDTQEEAGQADARHCPVCNP